jgi:hypothetical protein
MSHVRCPNCGITVASRGVSMPVCVRCIRRGQGRHLMMLVPAPGAMRRQPPAPPAIREQA